MKKSSYRIEIQAPVARVWQTMLTRDSYRQWTAAFHPDSDYEGGWNKGDKIYFLGPTENGKRQGMIAEIIENIPNTFVSIRHYGIVNGDDEITKGPSVEPWAGAFENYTFKEQEGSTHLTVELDIDDKYVDYFDEAWPRALQKLKALCES